jgi:hypothetical protein
MMLWVYPLVTLLYGSLYMFQSPARLQSGAFELAKGLWPLRTWGLIFLCVAALKIACILVGTGRAYIAMMCLGAGLYTWWGVLFLGSAVTNHTASYTGCLLPFGWALAHMAMLATTVRGEGIRRG